MNDLRTTNYELQTTNYKLQTTNYKLQTTNYKLSFLSLPTNQSAASCYQLAAVSYFQAGRSSPLKFSSMYCLTSGDWKALTNFWYAGLSLSLARAAMTLT